MPGKQGQRLRRIAVRQWYTRGRRAANRSGDAGHDLVFKTRRVQRLCLLATASKHKRIASLETAHALAGGHESHKQFVDLILAVCRTARCLADRYKLCIAAGKVQNFIGNQPVVQNHIRRLHGLQRLECQQTRVARPGTDQPGAAGLRAQVATQGFGYQLFGAIHTRPVEYALQAPVE